MAKKLGKIDHVYGGKAYFDKDGKVDFNKVKARFEELKKKKVSLCNKYFNDKAFAWAQLLPDADQVC